MSTTLHNARNTKNLKGIGNTKDAGDAPGTANAGSPEVARTAGKAAEAGTAGSTGADTGGRTPPDPAVGGPPEPPRGSLRRLPSRLASLLGAVLVRTAAIAALLVLWEAAPRLGLADATFLPPFSDVAVAWWELLADGQLLENTRASLVRSLAGFGLAVAVAVPLGLLIGWYRPVADLLGPLLEVFRNTAALALLPVFVLLLGIGETSKIAIVLYACTWPILLNTVSAVRTVDPTLVRLARSLGLSPYRLFRKVVLPSAVPTVFTGIRLAGAVAILVLVAAEMVGAKAGLGYLINASQYNFAIPQMYAGIITISALGLAFNQLLVALERRFTSWRTPTGN